MMPDAAQAAARITHMCGADPMLRNAVERELRRYTAEVLRGAAQQATIAVYHESGKRMAVGVDELNKLADQMEAKRG